MANVIRLKRASGSDPAASDLVSGEPAVRTDTGELFFKKDDGSVAKVSGAGGGPDFKYLALRNAANNGAASFPNADFTLVTSGTTSAITPTAANTLLVSVNGVIQKPNTGTSTPSSGFALSGSTIKFGANISAAPDFILYQESGGIGEPSDETVSEEKLKVSNSPVNGYFLSAQSGNNGGLTWAAPVATSCTGNSATATALATARTINGTSFDGTANITVTAAAGTLTGNTLNSSIVTSSLTSLGDLAGLTVDGNSVFTGDVTFDGATAGRDIVFDRSDNALEFADNAVASFGASADFRIFHNGSDSILQDQGTGSLIALSNRFHIKNAANNESLAQFIENGAVELYFNNGKKFETSSSGAIISGILQVSNGSAAAPAIHFGDSDSGVYGDSSNGVRLTAGGSDTIVATTNGVTFPSSVAALTSLTLGSQSALSKPLYFADAASTQSASILLDNSSQELRIKNGRFSGKISFTTYNQERAIFDGADFNIPNDSGKIQLGASQDLQIYHDGSHSRIENSTGAMIIQAASSNEIQLNGNGQHAAKFNPTGTSYIYHNGNLRFSISATNTVHHEDFVPSSNNTFDLGQTSYRWRQLYSTGLNVSGGTTPATITHTGGNALTLTRSSKNLNFNANYGAANTHATIDVTSGMELRFQVAGTDRVKLDSSGHWLPTTNNARDLGSTSLRWRNVYTNDLNLSNEGGSNEVDGTWGSYTIQEGAEDLFLVNKRNGKKYKFNLTEVS